MLWKINLQLFADGDIEEPANLDTKEPEVVENAENEGDQQPIATPEEQSKDKNNPANRAFAEMRRKIKEYETKVRELEQRQKEKDEYYAELAKKAGRTDITSEEEYRKALELERLSAEYKKSGDPLILAEIMKRSLSQPQPVNHQPSAQEVLGKEIEDFNKEFNESLKSVEDILDLPNSDKIIDYMEINNLPLKDAYKLANPDKIMAAAKQAAVNQIKGFDHVKSNSNAGSVDTYKVSADEIAAWKRRHGKDKTDEQCRKEIIEAKKLLEE